jgi:hypothetical protein
VALLVHHAHALVGEHRQAQPFRAVPQEGRPDRGREDRGAVVEPAMQVPPLPVAEVLRGGVEVAGGVGDVVVLQRRGRRRQAGAVSLVQGRSLLVRRQAGVVLGLGPLLGLAHGKENRADQSHDQRGHHAGHARCQRRVPPGELGQLVQHRRRPCPDRLVPQAPSDVGGQVRGGGVAPPPVLLQGLGRDNLDVAAEVCVDRAEPRRLLLPDHPRRLRQREALHGVRPTARQQLEEDHPQRVHVRAPVQHGRPGRDLLRAHVAQCADQLSGSGVVRAAPPVGVGGAGDAEVEDLGLAGLVHQDVAGLEVAVDDPLLVGVLHRVADPRQQLQPGRRRKALAPGVLVQRHAADELHREERPAVLRHPRLVDLGDAGVVQAAEDLRLLVEAPEQRRRDEAGPDHLHGDGAARVVLLRLVDGANAPLADQPQDAVAADVKRRPRRGPGEGGRRPRGADERAVQEAARPLSRAQAGVVGQQPLHGGAEAGGARAGGVQQSPLFVRRQVGRLMKQVFDRVALPLTHPPSLRRPAARPPPAARRARRGRSASRARRC